MNIAIILSGGIGTRMGAKMPKQYIEVGGSPIIYYSLKTFLEHGEIDAVVIGVAEEWKNFVKKQVQIINSNKHVLYAMPGETRQYSIYNALKVVETICSSEDDIVVVHDAARPLVTDVLISRCLNGCKEVDGVMPVIPVKDTIYLSTNGKQIKTLLDRSHLWAGQAPEAFVFHKYLKIHESMSREEILKVNGSTEIAFNAGLNCQMIEGDPMNFKVTTMEDLSNFEAIVNQNKKQE